MDYNEILKMMGQKRQEIGQRYADMPKMEENIRSNLFGNDSVLKSLDQGQTAKISELYSHDKVLADRYANPQSEGYLEDPYAREKARAVHFGATATELSDIQNQSQRRRDVLGDALEKALKMLNYGLEASKLEYSGLQDEFDNKMKLDEFALKKKESGAGNGSADLSTLYNAILGLNEKKAAAKPQSTYTTKRKIGKGVTKQQLVSDLRKQFKGKQLDLTYNKDGSITAAVRNSNQTFLTPEEADTESSIKKMVAATIAANPKVSGDALSLMELLGSSGSEYQTPSERSTDFQAKVNEAQAKVNQWRNRDYLSEEQVQAGIAQILQRAPELKGYIK